MSDPDDVVERQRWEERQLEHQRKAEREMRAARMVSVVRRRLRTRPSAAKPTATETEGEAP